MMHKMFNCLQKFDHHIENKGDHLVVTFKGSKADIAKFEETLKAIHTLHKNCCCVDDCCETTGKKCC